MSISPQLGREHRVAIPQGAISYRDCGNGSPIVFVHGVGVNGDLLLSGSLICFGQRSPREQSQ